MALIDHKNFPPHDSLAFSQLMAYVSGSVRSYREAADTIKANPEKYKTGAWNQVARLHAEYIQLHMELVEYLCEKENVTADKQSVIAGNELLAKIKSQLQNSVTGDAPETPTENKEKPNDNENH